MPCLWLGVIWFERGGEILGLVMDSTVVCGLLEDRGAWSMEHGMGVGVSSRIGFQHSAMDRLPNDTPRVPHTSPCINDDLEHGATRPQEQWKKGGQDNNIQTLKPMWYPFIQYIQPAAHTAGR